MSCPACGTENRADARFCRSCGAGLGLTCPNGHAVEAGSRFCDECGATVEAGAAPVPSAAPTPPTAERRIVSILFADLVGFTAASEGRDAEETRELLSRYFETCSRLISLYGGTVEKFIGDAVMAVWGAPVAMEDDAERAVRAALDLVGAVKELDPNLNARAGVLTGEAAVTIGAEGQGMVAGDLVNTASRIQSAAEPATVLVGEATKRATDAAVAYDDAGVHDLKGKAEPVQLFRALRVTGGRAGVMRAAGLEPPFVGRDRELRLIKELFHATAEERRAQLVSVVGIAGIGKSRLSWEFEKYIDGLAGEVWWHRGRCLSYGEGVAYWALAEMVRMRCGIAEDEEHTVALDKLRTVLAEHLPDADERGWVEPRLAHLLGLEEGLAGDQENLFSAWRVLFERLAEQNPVVLVFEDVQWADTGLLDFLDYLLDWARSHSIFVLTLARPEVADKHPTWGAGKRAMTSLYLEPLSAQAMHELLTGLVPGLPDELSERILDRAEGVPLYAVETVRMLLDRGALVQDGNVFRPTGAIDTLAVPETLHALVAARLDGLAAEERRLVQDGAVLGKTFTKQGIAALTGLGEAELEPLLASLLRKEVLSIQADPQSPERGHYSFLQDIVKHVAYETLSKRERKAKHLAAAEFLGSTGSAAEDEIVEVVATHYLDAYQAAPDDPDADEIRTTARAMLVRAAERAASLAATVEAQRAYERALELTDEPDAQAELHEQAGIMARAGTRADEAIAHYERAIELFEAAGSTHPAARVSARLAEILWVDKGRLEEGIENMERAFEVLSTDEPDEALASLAAQLGRFLFFHGEADLALQRIETALEIAEALGAAEIVAEALNTKAIILAGRGRHHESQALLPYARDLALEHDKPSAALRAYYNIADTLCHVDRYREASKAVDDGLALSRRIGERWWERQFLGQLYPLFMLGAWDELESMIDQLPEDRWSEIRQAWPSILTFGSMVHAFRGKLADAELLLERCAEMEASGDLQERGSFHLGRANLLLVAGDAAGALAAARLVAESRETMGLTQEYSKQAFVTAVEAALELGDVEQAEEMLTFVEALPAGRSSLFYQAQTSRFRAQLASRAADVDEADRRFKRATGLFRELALVFYLAVAQLEHGEWLSQQGRPEEAGPLLAEAREIFERLRAAPWLARAEAGSVSDAELAR